MSDDNSSFLSRRKLLGGLGTMGLAGALGGTTTSLLWDEEKFGTANNPNVLEAGSLDLKVDWTEHYADWIGAETEVEGIRMVEGPDDLMAGEVGLPTPQNPMIAVPAADTDGNEVSQVDEFMEATTVESSPLTDQPGPVVTLEDVKPGDFGEVTFSYHIFDNPGFASVCAEEHADSDNGINEPEDKVNGHDPDESDGTEGGDLGDHVQAFAWYDPDCDNQFDGGEVEVMLMTDVSESMTDQFPGTPADVDGATGDGGSRLEAVRGAVGDYGGSGFLSDLAASCADSVEIGAVSASLDLHHLDNRGDGDDLNEPGFDDGGLRANLDKALGQVGGADYGDVKNLFGTGADFDPDFVTDDPINNDDYDPADGDNTYEAERPYIENGDSTQLTGMERALNALLPDGLTVDDLTGIDPSGNAADPGDARKMVVPFIDGKFTAIGDPPGEEINTAAGLSAAAEAAGIEILPVVVNNTPTPNDVEFADVLSTTGVDPQFAIQYDGAVDPADCDSDVTDAGFSCKSLTQAVASVRQQICASAGGEQVIAGPDSISNVIGSLSECQLLDPVASGSTVSAEFGGVCHEPSNTGCVSLAWWLPRDIPGVNDNVIQTDRYEFQVSFEAVQCRHNSTEDGQPIQTLPEADDENNAQHYN